MPCRGSKKHSGRRSGFGSPAARAWALARWYWPSAMARLTAPMSFTLRAASRAAVPRSYAFSAAACSAAASGWLLIETSAPWSVTPALSAIRSSCAAALASLSSCWRRLRIGRQIRRPPSTASRMRTPTTIRTVVSTCDDPLAVLPAEPVPVPEPACWRTLVTNSDRAAAMFPSAWCCLTTWVAMAAAPCAGSMPLL